MTSFTITPVEKGIMRCRHTAAFTPEDIQVLARFFDDYGGKLLVDLTGSSGEDCARHIGNLRPMMPIAAVFGAPLDPVVLAAPDSYYLHEVRYFGTEAEALAWLRNQ